MTPLLAERQFLFLSGIFPTASQRVGDDGATLHQSAMVFVDHHTGHDAHRVSRKVCSGVIVSATLHMPV